jgi:hypothetical protein
MTQKNNHQWFRKIILVSACFSFLLMAVINCTNDKKKNISQETESIFNGKDLKGWVGDTTVWKAEGGKLVGSTMEKIIDHAVWITTDNQYDNFELSLSVKLIGDANKNSGVYYRGSWEEDVVVGYEFDIGGWGAEEDEPEQNWWGELHDPYGRGDELWVGPGREVIDKTYKESDWNEVKIRADGNHIQHWLNGTKMVDWFEQDSTIQKSGFIGFQLHDESKCKVYFKDIRLVQL